MPRHTLNHRGRHRNRRHTIRLHNDVPKVKQSKVEVGVIRADWCGHCNALRPEWDAMEKEITTSHDKDKYIFIPIEDSDEDKDEKISKINTRLSQDNQLVFRGYPTLFRIENDHLDEYQGERKKDALIKWVRGGNSAVTQNGGRRHKNTKKGGRAHKKPRSVKSYKKEKKVKKKEKGNVSESSNKSEKIPFSPTSSLQRMIGGCDCDGGKDSGFFSKLFTPTKN